MGRLPGCWQHPELAGQRWAQDLGVSTIATRQRCLSTLVSKPELVDCTSLFLFHVPGSLFAPHFRKVASSGTPEVDNTVPLPADRGETALWPLPCTSPETPAPCGSCGDAEATSRPTGQSAHQVQTVCHVRSSGTKGRLRNPTFPSSKSRLRTLNKPLEGSDLGSSKDGTQIQTSGSPETHLLATRSVNLVAGVGHERWGWETICLDY